MSKLFIPVALILAVGFVKPILPGPILPAPILSAQADSSANSTRAESYIAGFFRATVETAVTPQSDEYATKAVKGLLQREIQLNETARFMLGRAWPSDNKEAGRRFQEEFGDFVAEVLCRGLRANPNLTLAVKGSRDRPDGSTLVSSLLMLPSGSSLPIDWRLEQKTETGTFQITDMTVAGIDGAIMLRTMAASTLTETGIDGLIPRWRAALFRRAPTAAAGAEPPTVTSP